MQTMFAVTIFASSCH